MSTTKSDLVLLRYLSGRMEFGPALALYFIVGFLMIVLLESADLGWIEKVFRDGRTDTLGSFLIAQFWLVIFWPLPIGLWKCSRKTKVTRVIGGILSYKDFIILTLAHGITVKSFLGL